MKGTSFHFKCISNPSLLFFLISFHLLLHSKHERQIKVGDTVSDVDATKNACVAPVVSIVALPQVVSKDSNTLCGVLVNAPTVIWLIC